ncbi:G-protein coupled receptor Mth2-like isoform X1 [Temnothorax longispinosus]|uniref:G-protein coupled receptor Mth2-like isoform X1 n=2 Tax=Temnothorax longispinosus TaxID=300112 RepID=UPI003A9A156B
MHRNDVALKEAKISFCRFVTIHSRPRTYLVETFRSQKPNWINSLTMCPPNIVLWCFVLLLVASFSKSQINFTNGDERSDNSMVRYHPLISSVKYFKYRNDEMESTQCNSCKNSIKNGDEMQYESRVNSTKNADRKNDDSMWYESREHIIKNREQSNQMSMESYANSTEINVTDSTLQKEENLTKVESESDSTPNELYGNSTTDDYDNTTAVIVPYKACDNVTCIQLCCPFGDNLTSRGKCVADGPGNYSFPRVFAYNFKGKRLNELFRLTVHDPCVLQGLERGQLNYHGYVFLNNGSLYLGPDTPLILPTSYCVAILQRNIYDTIVCANQIKVPIYISACLLISLPFLLLTFIVYSILPELQNMHGYTLRAHVASLFVTYAIMYFGQQNFELSEWRYCVPLAYIFNFSFLSTFFWLNVTCFDIWWTFRGLRSHQTNMKQDKKRFVMYSLYAWGITFILNVICAIMDYAPGIPESYIRPEMCKIQFWFSDKDAKTLYFYIPMGATIISNICFFIATTLTILYQNIRTAHQLRDAESRRHNENKQRFNMYLKLFIVMGITWVMELIAWSINVDFVPAIVWSPINIINGLQGVIIFIIFVFRKKVKQLLLKRFGGRNCGPFCKIPMSSDSTMNTVSTSGSGTHPMREISSSN